MPVLAVAHATAKPAAVLIEHGQGHAAGSIPARRYGYGLSNVRGVASDMVDQACRRTKRGTMPSDVWLFLPKVTVWFGLLTQLAQSEGSVSGKSMT